VINRSSGTIRFMLEVDEPPLSPSLSFGLPGTGFSSAIPLLLVCIPEIPRFHHSYAATVTSPLDRGVGWCKVGHHCMMNR